MHSLLGSTLSWFNAKAVTDARPHGFTAGHSDIHRNQMDTMMTRLAADSMWSWAVIGVLRDWWVLHRVDPVPVLLNATGIVMSCVCLVQSTIMKWVTIRALVSPSTSAKNPTKLNDWISA